MRALRLLLIGTIGAALPPAVDAQSADASATVTVVSQGVTVVPTADLDFGDRTRGSIVRSSQVPTAAAWSVTYDVPGDFLVSFTLPSTLTQGFTGSIPISVGNTAATITSAGTTLAFDPHVPISIGGSAGEVQLIELGRDFIGDGSGDVIVDLTGAPDGTYSGTITLTYAVP